MSATAPASQSWQAFDPKQPSTHLRERWKYSRLPAYAALIDEAGSCEAATGPFQVTGVPQPAPIAGAQALTEAAVSHDDWASYPLAAAAIQQGLGWQLTLAQASALILGWGPGNGFGLIDLEANAAAEISVTTKQSQADSSVGALLLRVGPAARLSLDLGLLSLPARRYLMLRVELARDAQLVLRNYIGACAALRVETHVVLSGPGCDAVLDGAALVAGREQVDQQLVVEHRSPQATSRHSYHCVGSEQGQSTFGGRIHIHPGARGSLAELSNRNLALSAGCTLNTKPELEIYNDDVRCAHGATVGQLDADALFYLRSRGIDAARAQRLLTRGFLEERLAGPLAEAARDTFMGALP
ncbi:MAG: SufD family Fe-S cluster assembly protein [Pseudomonadota bacterium]